MTHFTRARADDPRLAGLQLLCLPSDQPRDFATDAVWMGDEVAFCSVRIMGLTAYLSRAGVIQSARGQGLQKRMIRLRVAYARKQGCLQVVTDCTPENHASANSLMSCGFRLYQPAEPWALPNSLYWRLKLC